MWMPDVALTPLALGHRHRSRDGSPRKLGEFVRTTGVRLVDGMLTVDLVRDIPDGGRPRRVEMVCGAPPRRQSKVPSKVDPAFLIH
jgi:hypothetical protein